MSVLWDLFHAARALEELRDLARSAAIVVVAVAAAVVVNTLLERRKRE